MYTNDMSEKLLAISRLESTHENTLKGHCSEQEPSTHTKILPSFEELTNTTPNTTNIIVLRPSQINQKLEGQL